MYAIGADHPGSHISCSKECGPCGFAGANAAVFIENRLVDDGAVADPDDPGDHTLDDDLPHEIEDRPRREFGGAALGYAPERYLLEISFVVTSVSFNSAS